MEGNPVKNTDPDGREPNSDGGCCGGLKQLANEFVAGAMGGGMALVGNLTGLDLREAAGNQIYGNGGSLRQAFDDAGTRVDKLSVGLGTAMVAGGTYTAAGGAGASLTGVGASVGVPAMVAGGATAVYGGFIAANALNSLQNSRVEAKQNRRVDNEHTSNARKSTENKHEDGQARKAKEQKAADEKYEGTKSDKGPKKSNNEKKKDNPDYYRKRPKLE